MKKGNTVHQRPIKRAAHTPLGHAWESFEKGRRLFELQDFPGAIAVFESSLKQFRAVLESEGEAMAASAIAAAYGNNGMHEFAMPFAEEALDAFIRLGHAEQVAEQRQNLGSLYMSCDRAEQARQSFAQAAEDFISLKNWERAGDNALLAANLNARDNQFGSARTLFLQALENFSKVESGASEHSRATGLMQLAYLEKVEKNMDAARLLYAEALEAFQAMNSPWEIGSCLEGLAAVEFEADALDAAVLHAKAALDTFQQNGFRRDALRAKVNYRAVKLAQERANRLAAPSSSEESAGSHLPAKPFPDERP